MSDVNPTDGVQHAYGSVLIVDDDAMARRLYSRCLRRAGYDVVCANSGADALQILDHQAFDLVLLDIVMPQLTGIELLEMLPTRVRRGGARFVMMSGTRTESEVARCEALGAQGLLVKPVPAALLREQAQRATRA